jgi:cytidylate kinase
MVVAIDGPAASGKSTTAKRVAATLGFRHVDSGAFYRAATAARIRDGGAPETWTEESVLESARTVGSRPTDISFATLLDGTEAEDELRGSSVTAAVSLVAQMQRVRSWVNEQVRNLAREYDVVIDGRDIGTAVFPDAAVKVFLIADPEERARRRLLQRNGVQPTAEEVRAETEILLARDIKDAKQSAKATDAVLIDTTSLTQDQQVAQIVALAKEVLEGR